MPRVVLWWSQMTEHAAKYISGSFSKVQSPHFSSVAIFPCGSSPIHQQRASKQSFPKVREVTTQWYLQRTFTWIPFLISSTTPSDFIIDTSSKWAIQYNESISTYIWLEKYSVVHLKETIYRWQTFTICTVDSTTSAAFFLDSLHCNVTSATKLLELQMVWKFTNEKHYVAI